MRGIFLNLGNILTFEVNISDTTTYQSALDPQAPAAAPAAAPASALSRRRCNKACRDTAILISCFLHTHGTNPIVRLCSLHCVFVYSSFI